MPREISTALVELLTEEIIHSIESGQLQSGDRLPTERDLATNYGASRAMVRRALEALERHGKIIRHVGRGTFVAGGGPLPEGTVLPHDVSPADLAIARMFIEPPITEYAAIHATMADFEKIREYFSKSEAATDAVEFDYWDREFHTAIAAAAHNSFVLLIMDAVNDIRRSPDWSKISILTATETRRQVHSKDHRAIFEALVSRNAVAAREAMHHHLDNVARLMRGGVAT